MSQIKRNDFIVILDAKGEVVQRLMPPHLPQEKGFGMPHKVNANNRDIAHFGAMYARKFRHDKQKRR